MTEIEKEKFNELMGIANELCGSLRDEPSGCECCPFNNWNPRYKVYYEEFTNINSERGIAQRKVKIYDTDEEFEAIQLFNEDTFPLGARVKIIKTEFDESECYCYFDRFKEENA